jgi:hypothetical protein
LRIDMSILLVIKYALYLIKGIGWRIP